MKTKPNIPNDSQFRFVLSRLSAALKKHAEFLAFHEAKKTHDVLHIVGHRKICRIYNISKSKTRNKQ